MFGRYYVQRGNSTQEEVQPITEKTDQENLIQIELLVCGRCAVDRGRERSKLSVQANFGIRLTSPQRTLRAVFLLRGHWRADVGADARQLDAIDRKRIGPPWAFCRPPWRYRPARSSRRSRYPGRTPPRPPPRPSMCAPVLSKNSSEAPRPFTPLRDRRGVARDGCRSRANLAAIFLEQRVTAQDIRVRSDTDKVCHLRPALPFLSIPPARERRHPPEPPPGRRPQTLPPGELRGRLASRGR
jgi:hypothetical protein